MKGQTSRLSLESVKKRSEAEILKSPDPVSSAQALFFLSSLLSSRHKVLEAFSDSSHTPEEKAQLASCLLSSPSAAASKIMALLSSSLWSQREDLAWGANEMGKECLMEAAKKEGKLEKVRGELEAFHSFALSFPLLDRSLSDRLARPPKRSSLCRELLPEEFEPESRAFAERCAEEGGGRYSGRLLKVIGGITSFMGEAGIEVRSASPLTARQASDLKEAYAKKLGKPVHLRQILDPGLVGGFKVRCGAEVTDMSAQAQLKALCGAMRKEMAFSIKV